MRAELVANNTDTVEVEIEKDRVFVFIGRVVVSMTHEQLDELEEEIKEARAERLKKAG